MIAKLGKLLTNIFSRIVPDPFVIAIGLTILAALLAITLGQYPGAEGLSARSNAMIDSWRGATEGSAGIWTFLGFGMQMCLILVTGHALAASKPVGAMIRGLARLPNSAPAAAAIVGFVAALFGMMNWGLGLIVGALFAREVARQCARKGIRVHGGLLAASGYMGLLVWHGGFSGTAPLKMSTPEQARDVLPAEVFEALSTNGIPLSQTILSPMNLFVAIGLLVLLPMTLWMLTPKRDEDIVPMPIEDEDPVRDEQRGATTFPEKLDRSPVVAWALAAMLIWASVRFLGQSGLMRLGPDEVNIAMLAIGLVMHGSIRSYIRAAEEGARGCAGIILQFPLYAGIVVILSGSGLIDMFSESMGSIAGERTAPLMTFLSAGVVNLFVPSGGGQWAIQGPIALEAGALVGVHPAKMIMSVAYGDQLTNMLQPFWALPLLAITKVKAREIVGYTAVVMVVAGAWMVLGLLLF